MTSYLSNFYQVIKAVAFWLKRNSLKTTTEILFPSRRNIKGDFCNSHRNQELVHLQARTGQRMSFGGDFNMSIYTYIDVVVCDRTTDYPFWKLWNHLPGNQLILGSPFICWSRTFVLVLRFDQLRSLENLQVLFARCLLVRERLWWLLLRSPTSLLRVFQEQSNVSSVTVFSVVNPCPLNCVVSVSLVMRSCSRRLLLLTGGLGWDRIGLNVSGGQLKYAQSDVAVIPLSHHTNAELQPIWTGPGSYFGWSKGSFHVVADDEDGLLTINIRLWYFGN